MCRVLAADDDDEVNLLDPGTDFLLPVAFCERLLDRPIGYLKVRVRVLRLSDQRGTEKLIVIVVKRYERSAIRHGCFMCFWALNQRRPMKHNKKSKEGAAERVVLLRPVFPQVATHLANRPRAVGTDDLLDAAAAAWTALRWYGNEAECVCTPEHDEKGLAVTIYS